MHSCLQRLRKRLLTQVDSDVADHPHRKDSAPIWAIAEFVCIVHVGNSLFFSDRLVYIVARQILSGQFGSRKMLDQDNFGMIPARKGK